MGHTRTAVLTLSVIALAVSGCGGSSKALTRAELTNKTNDICRRVNAKMERLGNQAKDITELGKLAPRFLAYEQGALTELGRLVPPAELADDWKLILADAQTLADYTAKLGEYGRTKNVAGQRKIILSSQQAQQHLLETAKRDGFTDCKGTI